jgi:hypothetical protein
MAPAGQMWSTVTDLATYADFVLHGHPDVLALPTLQEAAVERHPGSQYGLGFRTVPGARGRLVGHTGTMPGFMAVLLCERATGAAFVGFTNATVGQLSVALATSMLDALAESDPEVGEPWRPTTDVPDEVRELVGVWHWGETAFELSWDSGELRMLELRAQAAYEEYHREDRGWVGHRRHPARGGAWSRRRRVAPGERDIPVHTHAVRRLRADPGWPAEARMTGMAAPWASW